MPARRPPRDNTKSPKAARRRRHTPFPDTLTVIIHQDGSVSHLHHDGFAFKGIGPQRIRRASHVEPVPTGSGWEVRLPDSHRLIAKTTTRNAALAREQQILNARILPSLASAFHPL